jgi:hypothetical protein
MKKGGNNPIVESIFKAINVVELQIWLQYLINMYQKDSNTSILHSSSSVVTPPPAVVPTDAVVAPSSKRRNTTPVETSSNAVQLKAQKDKELFKKRNSYLL